MMLHRPPLARHQARQQARQRLTLKVEFENAACFRASYLPDLADGGLRIHSSMEVGQRFVLDISFLWFADPLQIEAEVQWSLPAGHPDGPATGLAFVDPSPEARAWLSDVLDASNTQVFIALEPPSRVLLLETELFLRDIYGQEVRNWAELRDEEPLELIALDDPAAWLDEVHRAPAMLGIIDVDGLPAGGLGLYSRIRDDPGSAALQLPLILIGSPANIEPFTLVSDDLMLCLRKPLRFGLLMNTVRVLARDPLRAPRGEPV